MSLDGGMLWLSESAGCACWRSYGWTEPAVTFGYSQRWEWIVDALKGFHGAAVRRMTGGGMVDHRRDLTYALSLPSSHPAHRRRAPEVYRELHAAIARILTGLAFPAALAPCPEGGRPGGPPAGLCFAGPEPYDVVDPESARKLAGAAMKRTRNGLLIQGSLSLAPLPGLDTGRFLCAFGEALSTWLDLPSIPAPEALPPDVMESQRRYFSSPDWNQRRRDPGRG